MVGGVPFCCGLSPRLHVLSSDPGSPLGGRPIPFVYRKLRHTALRSSVQGLKLSYRQELHPEPFPPGQPPTAQGEGRSQTESGSDDGHCSFQHRFWGRQTQFLSLVALRPAGKVWKKTNLLSDSFLICKMEAIVAPTSWGS